MKKLFIVAMCAVAVGSASAQKANVDAAKKLSGKTEQIGEARSLIQQAIENPETASDVYTYYVGGKIEFDSYNKNFVLQGIDPSKVDPLQMGENLINGYKMYIKALPLDSLPNAKGQIKPKYSKEMLNTLFANQVGYYDAGAAFYNAQQLDKAYDAFVIFGDIANLPGYKNVQVSDSLRAQSYYNGGLSAYFGNNLPASIEAFKKARSTNAAVKEAYIYEIACWQNIANRDETKENEALTAIGLIAEDGFKHFGTSEIMFLSNMVNSDVIAGNFDKALKTVNDVLANEPNNPAVYGLLGFVYDRMDKPEDSLNAYLKAASFENADYETLKNACKKLARTGAEKWNSLERVTPEQRKEIQTNYFERALEIANRAKAMNQDSDPDLDYVIENIVYSLETYFGVKQ